LLMKLVRMLRFVTSSLCYLIIFLAAVSGSPENHSLQNIHEVPLRIHEKARLLVMVLSDTRPTSESMRKVVRETWLDIYSNLHHFFCVGRSNENSNHAALSLEEALHDDFIRAEVLDGYENLSQKVFACFAIAVKKFSGTFDFMVKTDQDVFLRIDILGPELSDLLTRYEALDTQGLPLLHWQGFAYHSVPPMHDLSDKNADVSNTLHVFPPYTAGVAYVLSAALVHELVDIKFPKFMLNEDQTLGVWMEQRLSSQRVLPSHDIRFQQWDICFEGQVAHHFMINSAQRMQLISDNVRHRLPACYNIDLGSCCLCCDCWSSRHSWFRCDKNGAFLFMLNPISNALASAPALISSENLEKTFDSILLSQSLSSCAWVSQSWAALGVASLTLKKEDEVKLVCPAFRLGSFAEAKRHFCASSVLFEMPRSQIENSFVTDCPPHRTSFTISRATGRFETALSFGNAGLCSKRSIAATNAREQLSNSWFLVAAWVDTAEACMLNELDPKLRSELLFVDEGFQGPPLSGSFLSFCGLFIDLVHADGSTTTWTMSFARNASRYFAANVFRVLKPAQVVEAVVTVIIPGAGKQTSTVISDLSIRRLSFSDGRSNATTQAAFEVLSDYEWQYDPRQHHSRLTFCRNGLQCQDDIFVFVVLLFVFLLYGLGRQFGKEALLAKRFAAQEKIKD
jgi:hypothetical protein